MIQTGVRVSELVGLHVCDVHLGTGAHMPGHRQRPQEARNNPDRRDRRDPARMARKSAAAPRVTPCSQPVKDDRSAATQSAW